MQRVPKIYSTLSFGGGSSAISEAFRIGTKCNHSSQLCYLLIDNHCPHFLFFFSIMRLHRTIFCGLLLSTPLLGWSQNTESMPPTRLYVGVAAYRSAYQFLGQHGGLPSTFPVQVTLGYQVTPRLAVQTGVVYTSTAGQHQGTVFQTNGTPSSYSSTYRNRDWSVSMLGRYTLTRTPAARLQVDGLGGFTLERHLFAGNGSYPDANQPSGTATYGLNSHDNIYLFTLGVSVRYRFCDHLEAVAEQTANTNINAVHAVTGSSALGLRYCFGRY